jgi:hypothetical protein
MEPTLTRRRALVTALAAMLCCVLAAAFLLAPAAANADFTRPPFMNDQQWWNFALQVGPTGPSLDWHAQEQSWTPPGSDYEIAGIGRGGRCKEVSNIRTKHSPLSTHLWSVRLDTRWCFLGGRVTKIYPAHFTYCWPSSAGALVGYRCENPEGSKVRANCYGGNPEHCAYTFSWHVTGTITGYQFYSDIWCATTQVTGSGAHKRHGSCSLQPWAAATTARAGNPVGLQVLSRAQERRLEEVVR